MFSGVFFYFFPQPFYVYCQGLRLGKAVRPPDLVEDIFFVEANRIAIEIEKNGLKELDLSKYTYITKVTEYRKEDASFVQAAPDFCMLCGLFYLMLSPRRVFHRVSICA